MLNVFTQILDSDPTDNLTCNRKKLVDWSTTVILILFSFSYYNSRSLKFKEKEKNNAWIEIEKRAA